MFNCGQIFTWCYETLLSGYPAILITGGIAGVHEDTASLQKNGLFEYYSPLEFRPMVAKLLINNDLFAAKNSDLTFTDM